jgi:hypothetical protein
MELLGVLLGVTICVIVALGAWNCVLTSAITASIKRHDKAEERITVLERRKAVIAEAVAAQPKPAGVGGVKMRSWNEDMPVAE